MLSCHPRVSTFWKMTRPTAWSTIWALLFLLFALQLPAYADNIEGLKPGATIEVTRLRSGVLPGVIIGGHYEGILKLLQERYTATGELDERLEEAARHLIEDELSQAGYSVARSPYSSVFEEQLSEGAEPSRFLLGGTITQAKLNSYSSLWGDRTEDARTIRWEVFDRDVGRVIYRRETAGQAEAEGIRNPAANYEAIRISLKSLLAESDWAEILANSASADKLFYF